MKQIVSKDGLYAHFTSGRLAGFWEENGTAYRRSAGKCRTPFTVVFVEDWVKWKMGVGNHERYYTDLPYQLSLRKECSEYTRATVGVPLNPAVNLGSTIFASLFGGEIVYSESSSPWISPVVKDPADVRNLMELTRADDLLERGQLKQWLTGYDLFTDGDSSATAPRFGTSFHGMATLGCMLVGATDFIYLLTDHPDEAELLMQIMADVAIRFMDEMREFTGDSATGLVIANDDLWLLSPGLYEQFCLEPERRMFDHYSSSPSDMRGYHSDSPCDHHFKALAELGLTDVNISPNVTLTSLRQQFPDSVIHGQISALPFRDATVEEAASCVDEMLVESDHDPGLVMSIVGCLNEGTPAENILAAMLAIEGHGEHDRSTALFGEAPAGPEGRLLKGMPMLLEVE